MFDNRHADFEGKLERIVDSVARLVALPTTSRVSTKFKLRRMPEISHLLASGCRPNKFVVLKT